MNMLTNSKFQCILFDMTQAKRFLTVQEIARAVGISRQAVDKRIRVRKVKFETYGRTRLIDKLVAEKLLT